MLTGVILTRGALEVADEVRPFLDLDEDLRGADHGAGQPEFSEPLEFAVLLEEAALACGGRG